jgi:hypothetical protein
LPIAAALAALQPASASGVAFVRSDGLFVACVRGAAEPVGTNMHAAVDAAARAKRDAFGRVCVMCR